MLDDTKAPDPFAPLDTPDAAGRPQPEPDVWEPQLPAPVAPPVASALYMPGLGNPVRCWTFRDAEGRPLLLVARFEPKNADGSPVLGKDGKPKKDTIPYTYGRLIWTTKAGNRLDKTRWHAKAPPEPRPLYGLDRLAARPDAPVLVVEGEKAADAASTLFPEHVAMTWQGGSNATRKADWTALAGRQVVVWPDNDAPGRKAALEVAEALAGAAALAVSVVTVPADWPKGWDVADPLPEGAGADVLAELLAAASANTRQAPEAPEDIDASAEIVRLAGLSSLDYERERKAAADRMGLNLRALDREVSRARKRRASETAEAERTAPPPALGTVRWPAGFRMKRDGLYALPASDDPPLWIAAYFEVLGESRTATGDDWGLWLRWQDRDGRVHTWPMPAALLVTDPGMLEANLMRRGLRIAATGEGRTLLRQALGGVTAGNRVTVVSRAGWHAAASGVAAYVFPDGAVIGDVSEPLVMQGAPEDADRLANETGTLEAWKAEVAARAIGNPMAAFGLSVAFAGPLLEPADEASGGVHLCGRSKTGKTLAMRMAVSVWGLPFKGGALRDWRTTANGLEAACEESGDGLLSLDEIHQADPREVAGAIYMMANEGGKGRLRRDTTSQRRRTWRAFYLSNGEVDVPTMVAKAGQRLPAGAEVRLPSIPVDSGGAAWPQLHGSADFEALAAHLHRAMRLQHGTAARAFIERLARARVERPAAIAAVVDAMRARFAAMLPPAADAQVKDVARRLALVAAAGELATAWDVLPWPDGEAERAAAGMLRLWLAKRGGAEAAEDTQAIDRVRLFLVEHGHSRFVPLRKISGNLQWEEVTDPNRSIARRAGWRRPTEDRREEYLIAPDVFRGEVCLGMDATAVARKLVAAGFLERGEGKNLAKNERIPGVGLTRVYLIRPDMLGDPL